MKNKKNTQNPAAVVMDLIGTKWKVLVITNLLKCDMRFNELKKALGCTSKSLTRCLKEMENDGLVFREKDEKEFNKVVYYLTDIGYSLHQVVKSIELWGKDYKKFKKLQEKYSVKESMEAKN